MTPKYTLSSQLTKNFKMGEFFVTSAPGGQATLWEEWINLSPVRLAEYTDNILSLAKALQGIRDKFGKPITITSGWRSLRVNRYVGGASASRHLLAQAADIVVAGMSPKEVQRVLDKSWQGGLGYGDTFTHLDIRPVQTRFDY